MDMADPLSVSVSVLTLVGIAGESCQHLFNFLRTVSEAPKEVQRQIATLQALASTLRNIESLGKDDCAGVGFTSEFRVRIDECMVDLHAIESRIRKVNDQMEGGKTRRTWARLKWSLTADLWLNKFFARVQIYQASFALDLLTLQM